MLATDQFNKPALPHPDIRDCGDCAILVDFGFAPRLEASMGILSLSHRLDALKLNGFIESVPTFSTLTVYYDPLLLDRDRLVDTIQGAASSGQVSVLPSRDWTIPVVYGGESGPDLQFVSKTTGIDPQDVIALHSATTYSVYMLGFLPGFAYLGDTPSELRLSRRSSPRKSVPAGSIAIAADMTAIYPVESPGGWHLIGSTPIKLWDLETMDEPLLRAGDHVRFSSVGVEEGEQLAKRVRLGWRPQPGEQL